MGRVSESGVALAMRRRNAEEAIMGLAHGGLGLIR